MILAYRNLEVTKVCRECGAEFHPFKGWEEESEFCSIPCSDKFNHIKAKYDIKHRKGTTKPKKPLEITLICPVCGNEFHPLNKGQKCCCIKCGCSYGWRTRKEHDKRRRKETG